MSGGSWNYLFLQIEEAAHGLMSSKEPERIAFGRLMERCAKAMHEIEWVDSGDRSSPDDTNAIREALGQDADKLIMAELVLQAQGIFEQMKRLGVKIDPVQPSERQRTQDAPGSSQDSGGMDGPAQL
jgi:hypothetical protein